MRTLVLLLLMAAGFLGPGLALTRRLTWAPLERLTLAAGLSGVVLYLFDFAIFAFGLPLFWYRVLGAACIVACALSVPDLRRLAAAQSVRQAAMVCACLAAWVGLHLAVVRSYSGAFWYGDWFEHFERARFFVSHAPLDEHFLGIYWLPARPPLANVITAGLLASVAPTFPLFQIATAGVGLLVGLPIVLFGQRAGARSRDVLALLTFLIVLNPMFLENATYPWTRPFTNFYVLSGLYFYWQGLNTDDMFKVGCAFFLLAAGTLAHYSAGPYAVCVFGHFLVHVGVRRTLRTPALLMCGGGAALLLATWFGWSIRHYGSSLTFGSNTTVIGAQGENTTFLGTLSHNLWNTLVPPDWLYTRTPMPFGGIEWVGLRDSVFSVVQTHLLFAAGITAGVLFLYQVAVDVRRGSLSVPAWRFWAVLSVPVIVLGVAVCNVPEPFGVAHACLQPLVLLSLVRLSVVAWEHGRGFRLLLGLGQLSSYALGILLHFWYLGASFLDRPDLLDITNSMRGNWQLKQTAGLTFVGDFFARYQPVLFALEGLAVFGLSLVVISRSMAAARERLAGA